MSTFQFTLIAGVEITQGQVGALKKGEIDTKHTYGDPVAAAGHFIGQGAQWLHLADLDAAGGDGDNAKLIHRIIAEYRRDAHLQLAGGIFDDATLAAALHTGCQRIVIDTAALADLAWVQRALTTHGERVAVDITAHGLGLYAPGTAAHGVDVAAVLAQLGRGTFLATDVDAEGARKGSNRQVLAEVSAAARGHVIANGGIAHLEDLHHIVDLVPDGVTGAVVDRALYNGAFGFAEGLAAIAPRYDPYHWGPAQP